MTHCATISPTIFRAYDIRGIIGKELTAESVYAIGLALGNSAQEQGQTQFMVGRDGRLSSKEITNIVIDGLLDSGCDVVNIGMVPTPVLYFAAYTAGSGTGVMVTGSHNPSAYNGFKILIGGNTLHTEAIQALYQRIKGGHLTKHLKGDYSTKDFQNDYLQTIIKKIKLKRAFKVVVDCGNGVAGKLAPQLLTALGCEVIPLFCEIDGHFPNHHPDPMVPANLTTLIETVRTQKANLGLAFDGDGDRLGLVSESGEIIWPDRQLMLFAQDILKRHPGASIVYDVKCSRLLTELIHNEGGNPIMSPTGHSLIKAALKKANAPLAGEMSGHIFFNDNWYGFDDGLFCAARLLALLSLQRLKVSTIFAKFPQAISTPELAIRISEEQKFAVIKTLQQQAQFPGAEICTLDGVRVDYPNGWGLVRASNTIAALVCRFEAEDDIALAWIQQQFKTQLLAVTSDLTLPF